MHFGEVEIGVSKKPEARNPLQAQPELVSRRVESYASF